MAPLHFAARCGHIKAVQTLLEEGAHLDALDNSRETPMFKAFQAGSKKTVETLLNQGASIYTRNDKGQTLLDFAMSINQYELAKLLIRHKTMISLDNQFFDFFQVPMNIRKSGKEIMDLWIQDLTANTHFETSCHLKLIVLGPRGSGKSTLCSRLNERFSSTQPSRSSQSHLVPPKSTEGIDMFSITKSKIKFTLFDFESENHYAFLHHILFLYTNAVYLIVVDVSQPLDVIFDQVRNWFNYIKDFISARSSQYNFKVHLVGTKSDELKEQNNIMEHLKKVLNESQRDKKGNRLGFATNEPFIVNKSSSSLDHLELTLMEVASEQSGTRAIPDHYFNLKQSLSLFPPNKLPLFCTTEELKRLVSEKEPKSLFRDMEKKRWLGCLEYLHHSGVIVMVPSSNFVFLDPPFFLKLISAFFFTSSCSSIITLETAERRVEAVFRAESNQKNDQRIIPSASELMNALQNLEVCFLLSPFLSDLYGSTGYLFPHLRPVGRLTLPYIAPEQAAQLNYICWEYQPTAEPLCSLFFFSHLMVDLRPWHDQRYKLYRNGVVLKDEYGNQCLFRLRRGEQTAQSASSFGTIEVLFRGGARLASFSAEIQEALINCHGKSSFGDVCARGVLDRGRCFRLMMEVDGACSSLSHDVFTGGSTAGGSLRKDEGLRCLSWDGVELSYLESITSNPYSRLGRSSGKLIEISPKDECFERFADEFWQFIGPHQLKFKISRMEVIDNLEGRERFGGWHTRLLTRELERKETENSSKSDKAVPQTQTQTQSQPLAPNPVFGWFPLSLSSSSSSSKDEETLNMCEKGPPSPSPSLYHGKAGEGICLYKFPSSGDHLIKKLKTHNDQSSEYAGQLLLCYVLMGTTRMLSPKKEEEELEKPQEHWESEEEYHSHYCVLDKSFSVIDPSSASSLTPVADEILVFDPDQILPVCLVTYSRTSTSDDEGISRRIVVWVQERETPETSFIFPQLAQQRIELVHLRSIQEAKSWLSKSQQLEKMIEESTIRLVTRLNDSQEEAGSGPGLGQVLCHWIKNEDFCESLPVLLFAKSRISVASVASPAKSVWVTDSLEEARDFALFRSTPSLSGSHSSMSVPSIGYSEFCKKGIGEHKKHKWEQFWFVLPKSCLYCDKIIWSFHYQCLYCGAGLHTICLSVLQSNSGTQRNWQNSESLNQMWEW
eukprot:TRINITY_DN1519_c0_g2_i8.p1 TRINITY_DN1519_c0_g2~~TRINITY_DN1519_c0_g2_i8.p1  ORF type:complete len:1173 (+),score=281.90 TRINITY_DN1519_c0_g2_i8:391-3909(+)